MQVDLCVHPSHIRLAEVEIADGESLISIKVPTNKALKIAEAIKNMIDLAGHTVRKINNDGDELVSASEVFADVTPGRMLRGLRGKEGLTQTELAERLSITQNMVSDLESGRRNISLNMAKRIASEFKVPYKMFL